MYFVIVFTSPLFAFAAFAESMYFGYFYGFRPYWNTFLLPAMWLALCTIAVFNIGWQQTILVVNVYAIACFAVSFWVIIQRYQSVLPDASNDYQAAPMPSGVLSLRREP